MTVNLAFPSIREVSIWVLDKEHGLDVTFSMFSKGGNNAGGNGENSNNDNNSPGKAANDGGRIELSNLLFPPALTH